MPTLKTAGIYFFALLLAGWIGRVTAPATRQGATEIEDQNTAPGSRFTLRSEDFNRAMADVTPGQETEKQGPILSLLELSKLDGMRKLYPESERFAQSLDQAGVRTALERVWSLPRGGLRDTLTFDLMTRLAKLNPREATRFLADSRISANSRASLYATVASTWATQNVAAVEAWIRSLPENDLRTRAESGLFEQQIEANPLAALEMIGSNPRLILNNRGYASSIFSALAQKNPEDAARRALALPGNEFRKSAIASVAASWSRQDPRAAADWARGLPYFMQNDTLSDVISVWGRNDGPGAAAYVDRLPAAPLKYLVGQSYRESVIYQLGQLADDWGNDNPRQALNWAQSQNNPALDRALQVNFISKVLAHWSQTQPDEAAAQVLSLKDETARRNAVTSIASTWAKIAPERALVWLDQSGVDDQERNGLRNAVRTWTGNSAEDASAWLNQLALGEKRDVAISAFTDRMSSKDPQTALAWANSVTDQERRIESMKYVMRTWNKADPKAAQTWLGKQTFQPEEIAVLKEVVQGIR